MIILPSVYDRWLEAAETSGEEIQSTQKSKPTACRER